MSKSIDVVIKGHFINSQRAQYEKSSQTAAVRELVDNSVDANATLIQITMDVRADTITIEDDGDGCEDISLFFNVGGTGKTKLSEGRIGRYGIGGTWAGMYLCDIEHVCTTSRADRRQRCASMRWTDIAEGKAPFQWQSISDRRASAGEPHGTRIVLEGIRKGNDESRNIFQPKYIGILKEMLGRTYGAAIATRGLVIGINDSVVDAVPPPPMVDGSHELELAGEWLGRPWRLRARHIAQDNDAAGATWKPGVYVAYRGRLLNPDARPWTSGLGEHVGAPVWLWIELTDSQSAAWQLHWDKSDFEDREMMLSDTLSQEPVQRFLREVGERAQDIDSTLIGQDLTAMLNETLPLDLVLEKRPGNAGETGTVIPISSGIERRRAKEVDPTRTGTIEEERKTVARTRSWKFVPQNLGATGPLCEVSVSDVKRRTHGELVRDEFHVTVKVNTYLPEQMARLRDRTSAMALIAPAVAHKLARDHHNEFRQIYNQVVAGNGEQDELFGSALQAEKLAHVLMVRQASSANQSTSKPKRGAR